MGKMHNEGRKAANLNLATHRRWKDKDGNRQEDTQWHQVVFWGKQAELAERLLKKGQLVTLESTTYPGTTRGDMLPILEQTGLKSGEDFFVAYSPEREDPGRQDHSTQTMRC